MKGKHTKDGHEELSQERHIRGTLTRSATSECNHRHTLQPLTHIATTDTQCNHRVQPPTRSATTECNHRHTLQPLTHIATTDTRCNHMLPPWMPSEHIAQAWELLLHQRPGRLCHSSVRMA